MDLKALIINNNPEIKQFTQTPQYELSRQLMKERHKSKLPIDEICKLLDVSKNEYANLEFGDTSIPMTEYQKYVNELIKYNLKKKEPIQFSVNINNFLNKRETYISKVNYKKEEMDSSFKTGMRYVS